MGEFFSSFSPATFKNIKASMTKTESSSAPDFTWLVGAFGRHDR